MNSVRKLLPAICCIPLLSGCATNQTSGGQAWNVTPVTGLRHGLNDPDAWYQVGRYYQGQKRYALASEAFHKALEANPKHVEAINGLGVIYAMQGKYAEAVAEFKVALDVNSEASHIYNNLGYAYYLQGDYAGAVGVLEQAVKSDPANRRAMKNLGLAYAKTGNSKESAQAFADAATQQSAGESVRPAVSDSAVATAMAVGGDPTQAKADAEEPSTVIASPEAVVTPVVAIKSEEASLALPKDRGVIIRQQFELPFRESNTAAVMVSPYVYELHEKTDSTVVVSSAELGKGEGPRPSSLPLVSNAPVPALPKLSKPGVEVSNGNGITGLARKVAFYLRVQGFSTSRLTNQKPFNVSYSRIYYRSGYQDAARHLSLSLPQQPVMIKSDRLRAGTDIRLVLGKNATTRWASLDNLNGNVNFAVSTYTLQPVL